MVIPTIPNPGTQDYLIQLDVFHQLHCLNEIRKGLYPDAYSQKWQKNEDGSIDYTTEQFEHWGKSSILVEHETHSNSSGTLEHCIDTLRQTIMCHADVTPLPWRVEDPPTSRLTPRLATTHVCRNFTKIQNWAIEHNLRNREINLTPDQLQEYLENPAYANSIDTWENLSSIVEPGYESWRAYRDKYGLPVSV